ncbi:MAG: STT3 domain-containing protein [Pyrobaculum sp.]
MRRLDKFLLVVPPLLAIFAMALYVRMYRVFLWGWWIDEFDPYIRYYLARYTLENGVGWWWREGDHFTQFWYPHGVEWGKILLPGTSLYGLFVYEILRPLGVDLWHAVIAAPAVMNSLAVFSMFYLGYRVGESLGVSNGGVKVGLLAALLTAIAPAFIERGLAGWFDDEPISLFLIPLGLALLIDGLKRPWAGALAGVVLGYVAWTWGAHFYLWNLVGLYAVTLPTYYFLKLAFTQRRVDKKTRRREEIQTGLPFDAGNLFLSYLLFYVVYTAFVASIPRYGPNTLLSAFNILPTFGLLVTAVTWLLDSRIGVTKSVELLRKYMWVVVTLVAVGMSLFTLAIATGAVGGKFLATLFPVGRSAIVASVAEHATTAFGQILTRYGPLLPFIIAAVPYIYTPQGLVALTYLATAGYAAATMVRLLVLLAPIALVAAAAGIVRLMENRRLGFLVMAAALISIIIMANSAAGLARQPPQIVTSAVGFVSDDFLDALMWLKTRLPPYEPVASWWDYGYWISVVGNKTSLADNSTINATQIGKIGLAMMSPPQVGASIFSKELGAKYVLAIMPFYISSNILIHEAPPGGDFLKSYWMFRIAVENIPHAEGALGVGAASPEDFFYTHVMSYPGVDPRPGYAYFTVQGSPYPVPVDLNRTLYVMLFSKARLAPIYGNDAKNLPWIFEGVYQEGSFISFRKLGLVGGNLYLPGDIPPGLQGLPVYTIKSWTADGWNVVVDPLANKTAAVGLITTPPGPLRPVYISKPYGWVVVYEITS